MPTADRLPSGSCSLPDFVRARGGIGLIIGRGRRGVAPQRVSEKGGYRIRFPRSGEGVLINTGGGMAGGDRMSVDATVLAGADAILTTQAAEKIYRSDGPDSEIAIALKLASRSRLEWLPQEQILFDGARLRRTLVADMAGDAALTLVESVVFGRYAAGETLRAAAFRDRWRIRRDGRLVLAEEVRFEGAVSEILGRSAVGAGARAVATFLHVAPNAQDRCPQARAVLARCASEAGVSAWDGMLIARFLSPDPQALRADLACFTEWFRGRPMPRCWQT